MHSNGEGDGERREEGGRGGTRGVCLLCKVFLLCLSCLVCQVCLFYLVCLVGLFCKLCLVYQVCLVYLASQFWIRIMNPSIGANSKWNIYFYWIYSAQLDNYQVWLLCLVCLLCKGAMTNSWKTNSWKTISWKDKLLKDKLLTRQTPENKNFWNTN